MDNSRRWRLPMSMIVASDEYLDAVQVRLGNPNERDQEGNTVLHAAASSFMKNIEIIRFLISRGADVNAKTRHLATPLHLALCSQKNDTAEALIEAGASVNAIEIRKRSVLHIAVLTSLPCLPHQRNSTECDMRIVKKLLCHPDIDLNPLDKDGNTPLMWAVRNDHLIAVRMLLKHGANPNILNKDGKNPLHEALLARAINPDIVFTLLQNGCRIYSEDNLGQTPMDLLFQNVNESREYLSFVENCVKLIVLKYHVRKSLKRQLARLPMLSERFIRCCKEVKLMNRRVIYDKFTVHDFVCNCTQSPNPMIDIYIPVRMSLSSDLYIEYRNLITSGLDKISETRSIRSV